MKHNGHLNLFRCTSLNFSPTGAMSPIAYNCLLFSATRWNSTRWNLKCALKILAPSAPSLYLVNIQAANINRSHPSRIYPRATYEYHRIYDSHYPTESPSAFRLPNPALYTYDHPKLTRKTRHRTSPLILNPSLHIPSHNGTSDNHGNSRTLQKWCEQETAHKLRYQHPTKPRC